MGIVQSRSFPISRAQAGYTRNEAAKVLQYSQGRISQLIADGTLEYERLAGRPMILMENPKNAQFFAERWKLLEIQSGLNPDPIGGPT